MSLDLFGLKAHVLWRTEVLEAREREGGEVVLVLAPLPYMLGGTTMPQWAKASRKRPSIFLTMHLTYRAPCSGNKLSGIMKLKAYSAPNRRTIRRAPPRIRT